MVAASLLHAYAWLALLAVIFLVFLWVGDKLAERGKL